MSENRANHYAINILFLASVWAANEIFLGGWIKSVNIRYAGLYLSFFSVLIVVASKRLVPVIGSVILIGIIAAFFKFVLSGFNAGVPFFAILIQALIGEVVLFALKLNIVSAIISGVLIHCYTAFHPILHGSQLIKSRYYIQFKRWILSVLAADQLPEFTTAIYFLIIHVVAGILSGIIVWYFTGWLLKKAKEVYSDV